MHGAFGRFPDPVFSRVREFVPTGAEILQDAGFRTAAFVNCAFLDPSLGLDRGFDVFDYEPEWGFPGREDQARWRRR